MTQNEENENLEAVQNVEEQPSEPKAEDTVSIRTENKEKGAEPVETTTVELSPTEAQGGVNVEAGESAAGPEVVENVGGAEGGNAGEGGEDVAGDVIAEPPNESTEAPGEETREKVDKKTSKTSENDASPLQQSQEDVSQKKGKKGKGAAKKEKKKKGKTKSTEDLKEETDLAAKTSILVEPDSSQADKVTGTKGKGKGKGKQGKAKRTTSTSQTAVATSKTALKNAAAKSEAEMGELIENADMSEEALAKARKKHTKSSKASSVQILSHATKSDEIDGKGEKHEKGKKRGGKANKKAEDTGDKIASAKPTRAKERASTVQSIDAGRGGKKRRKTITEAEIKVNLS